MYTRFLLIWPDIRYQNRILTGYPAKSISVEVLVFMYTRFLLIGPDIWYPTRLLTGYPTKSLSVEVLLLMYTRFLLIGPDIRYPTKILTGYPAKSLSGAILLFMSTLFLLFGALLDEEGSTEQVAHREANSEGGPSRSCPWDLNVYIWTLNERNFLPFHVSDPCIHPCL